MHRPLALTAALLTTSALTTATLTSAHPAQAGPRWVHTCTAPARADTASCDALRVVGAAAAADSDGYGPAELRAAYGLPADGGAGAVIAVVDAYDHPRAEADLDVYRKHYGLPACTADSGCFRKTDQRGGTRLPRGNTAWAGEIALDLAMVSAVAPRARIVLVEADSAAVGNLGAAVNTAVALGAQYVSISWGTAENGNAANYDSRYFDHPGTLIAAASGDGGYGVNFPASSPHVLAVGGTTLRPDGSARGWAETAWATSPTEGTASGCSGQLPKPAWQTDPGCDHRTVADVAAVADPETGVAVYQSYGGNGWYTYGGTSAAAPLVAAAAALAGPVPAGSRPESFPYRHPDALHDVTSGTTATDCAPAYLCAAGAGYDGPTGLGSPAGVAAFRP
ncbi:MULTISPECIES: S8 family serine peptidase [Kitasatospora]|uniref:Putative serine endopeptidase n=1 Tax=Kitasatospora setae (strain ATCC 33774 / DSM 43861 / JCM 3304 / KCC A-0304 / NBRC 14216 / KM-6054) TaxID=452652 RepID=E4MZW5_KITSK|nr:MULTISPECIES: S8 family serine peptidase [Kitasatospora]BAJ30049.1 putative serine endopeptidase [Kitasatospora setae KM-6054]